MVKQVNCAPVYEWDGKFYANKAAAKAGSTSEEIFTHSGSTGRKELPKEKLKKGDPGYDYPGDQSKRPGVNVRITNNGKFLTNYMHPHCQKPALDSNTGWCGHNSTHDYIQMITESEKIELVKGVVTQGRYGSHNQWVTEFEVYVSRNGDSWKQVKNASGSTTFTGNSASTKHKKVKNYFNEVVEAKYIRFVTKKWNNYNSMRIGYIRDNSGVVNCKGGSGLINQNENNNPWFRFTFNKEKTKTYGKYSEGTAKTTKTCPNEGAVMIAEKKPDGIVYSTEFDA